MDIGLLVNLFDRTHEVAPGQEAALLKAGDIIAVQAWDPTNPDLEIDGVIVPPTPLDQGWLVVSGLPGAWTIERITDVLIGGGEPGEATGDPIVSPGGEIVYPSGGKISKRKWRIKYPAGAWATFVAQRWYRATWAQVRARVVQVKTGGTISDDDFLRAR